MAKIYRDINVQVNFGSGPTMFIGQSTNVMTENEIARLLITFPATYSDYTKVIDISYTSSAGTPLVESYAISYDDVLESYFFIVGRQFTYNKKIIFQFRARHSTGQEVVDPYKLSIYFKDAIKKTNLEVIDSNPSPIQTVILQGMVDEHAALIGSTIQLGHFKVDGETVIASPEGVLTFVTSSGYSGFSGYSGYSGRVGFSGPSGPSGPQGIQGPSGTSGWSGYSGQLPNGVRIFVQDTEPDNPNLNDVWINTG